MAAVAGSIQIDGLKDFLAGIRRAQIQVPVGIRLANKAAAELLATKSRSTAQSVGGVASKVAPTIRAGAGAAFASVRAGGSGQPYTYGAIFGSIRYKQFKPWRGNGADAGYFIYPDLRANRAEILAFYDGVLTTALRGAFPQ